MAARRRGVVVRTALALAAAALVVAGCGGDDDNASARSEAGDGPSLEGSVPASGAALEEGSRRVVLRFSEQLDTGAQLVVMRGDSDVVASTPELSNDRRELRTDIDVLDAEATYRVTYRVCSSRAKTSCSEGEYGFTAGA